MTENAMTTDLNALRNSGLPLIVADRQGTVREINQEFETVYGWKADSLVGESLSLILPTEHKMSHQLAFSRFQLPPQDSHILGHPLNLATRCSDGSEVVSEHFIIAEKCEDEWVFAATIKPLAQAS